MANAVTASGEEGDPTSRYQNPRYSGKGVPDRGDDPKRKFKAGSQKPMTRKQYSDWNDKMAIKYPDVPGGTRLHQAKGKDRF
jgi:hypothetical protein